MPRLRPWHHGQSGRKAIAHQAEAVRPGSRSTFAADRRQVGGHFLVAVNWPCHPKLAERRMAEREGFEPFSASKLSRLIHADLVDG